MSERATDRDDVSVQERLQAFEWFQGLLAGLGSFVAGYLVFVVYFLAGIVQIPAELTEALGERLTFLGLFYYNAHGIVVLTDTPAGVNAPAVNYVSGAVVPLVYQAVPVVVLLLASGVFTYWRRPGRRDGVVALATGLAMTIGYLLLLLVGTYLFVRTTSVQDTPVVLYPDRVGTLVNGLLYPLVAGTVGSIVAQAALVPKGSSVDETT